MKWTQACELIACDVGVFYDAFIFCCIINDRPDEAIQLAQKYQVTIRKTFSKAIGARYQDRFDRFPKAVPALSRGVSFPLYPFLSAGEVATVQKVIGILR